MFYKPQNEEDAKTTSYLRQYRKENRPVHNSGDPNSLLTEGELGFQARRRMAHQRAEFYSSYHSYEYS